MDDTCFVCNELLEESLKSDLSLTTNYSEKPIYQIIEAFTESQINPLELCNTSICENCVLKFNEYDELISRAEAIQLDLTKLLLEPREMSYTEGNDNEEIQVLVKKEDDEDDGITFEPLYFEENADELDPSLLNDDYQMEVVVVDNQNNINEIAQNLPKKGLKTALTKEAHVKRESENFLVVELDNMQRGFQCEICSKIFKDKSKLKNHRETHTTERNIECKECGKYFKTTNCLRNHKRMHLPVRTYYGCDRCEKKYTQKIQLKKHIEIVHMNRRDFVCPTCGAAFGTKSVMKMHMLSHTEQRKEECSVCGFRVHTKAKLRRHMKTHTGERDYECGICGKKFLYSYNVIAHVRNVHEKDKNQTYTQAECIEEEDVIEFSYEEA